MMHASFYRHFLLLTGSIFLSSCTFWEHPNEGKPNIIIISVEGLNFDRLSCSDPMEQAGGFAQLCSSGLRFTHFFSPSTLSQPTMTSLLTGSTLAQHKVVDNGSVSIPETTQTLPEKALTVGYRTAFLTGGPPLLCKSGLQQGFELCDDEFLTSDSTFRPIRTNFERAKSWISEQEGPFLLNLYVPDTQFYNQTTVNEEGKERARTFDSQVDEIDETLGKFLQWLKKEKYWANTVLIFTGLNGESLALRSTTWRENVYAENVHVPLFVKLPFTDRESTRSVDNILTHAELGNFVLGVLDSPKSKESFEVFVDGWLGTLPKSVEIRSDWPTWWFGYPPLISLRTEDYLVFPKRTLEIYHSVADQTEMTALSESQVGSQNLTWLNYRVDQSFDTQIDYGNELYTFLREINKQHPDTPKNIIERIRKNNKSAIVQTITTDIAVERNDWDGLKDNPAQAVSYVAQRNLEIAKIPQLQTSCERLFYGRKRLSLLRNCNDSLLLALLAWEKRIKESDALYWEKRFMRKYRFYRQYKHLAYRNLFIDLNWHVDSSRLIGPSLTDLYLRLPDKAHLRKTIATYPLPEGLNFLYD